MGFTHECPHRRKNIFHAVSQTAFAGALTIEGFAIPNCWGRWQEPGQEYFSVWWSFEAFVEALLIGNVGKTAKDRC
jgi:hypothetical protein